MTLAAALLWITFDANAASPRAIVGRGWTIAATADASFQPLFTYPDFQSGVAARGGFRLAHALRHGLTFAIAGRAGATYVDDWRPLFEGAATVSARDRLELRAGLRHDDRLRREGALSGFRDPTGRIFVDARALPLHISRIAAGGAVHYERAMPGVVRLPSAVSVTALAQVRLSR